MKKIILFIAAVFLTIGIAIVASRNSEVPAISTSMPVANTTSTFSTCGGVVQCNCGDTLTSSMNMITDIGPCSGNGILFGAGSIVLDCKGHTIHGDDSGNGPGVSSVFNNVELRNCFIDGFLYGVEFSGNSSRIINNTVNSNVDSGIVLYTYGGSNFGNLVANNTANSNSGMGNGIWAYNSSNNNFINNTVNSNAEVGIADMYGFNNNFINNKANSNYYYGIWAYNSSNNNFINNTANSNGWVGVVGEYSSNDNFTGNSLSYNVNHGIFVNNMFSSIFLGNTLFKNGQGFNIDTSHNLILQNNTILNNTNEGIFLNNTKSTNITGNNITNNQFGINISYAYVSAPNLIYNNYFENAINVEGAEQGNLWNITKTPGTNIVGGHYIVGNYWHDYFGVDLDGDGIADTNLPYNSTYNSTNLSWEEIRDHPIWDWPVWKWGIHNKGDYQPVVKFPILIPQTGPQPNRINITYKAACTENCFRIVFIQVVCRYAVLQNDAILPFMPGDAVPQWQTKNGDTVDGGKLCTVDRMLGFNIPYYGTRDYGAAMGTTNHGRHELPIIDAAWMVDAPLYSNEILQRLNSTIAGGRLKHVALQFETCAYCAEGSDAGKFYGCLGWTYIRNTNNFPGVVRQSSMSLLPNNPSSKFMEALNMWKQNHKLP